MSRVVSYVFLVAALAVVGGAAARALDAADLPKAIESAKTAADHEAIAVYFDEQAKSARESALRHKEMGAVYKKQPPTSPKSGGGHTFHIQMSNHCDDLVKTYEKAAKDFEAMAAAHRAMEKAAK